MTILLTGATGFIGSTLSQYFSQSRCSYVVAVRKRSDQFLSSVQQIVVDDLSFDTKCCDALNEIDTVIHLAARVHVMRDSSIDPLDEFRKINTLATLNLARQAATKGVRRFIYLSSVKVNGENTTSRPFVADEGNFPNDPYGISKYEAEKGLREISEKTKMEFTIIRPPLVYGPGVKGNFLSMLAWLQKGVPLPLGAIQNQRSLVYIDNLIDLIITCIDHPAAANQTFLVSDGEDLSTTELLYRMGIAINRPARLLSIMPKILKVGAGLVGKQDIAQRLLGSLQLDIHKTKSLLSWSPKVSVDEGLYKTAKWYLQEQ